MKPVLVISPNLHLVLAYSSGIGIDFRIFPSRLGPLRWWLDPDYMAWVQEKSDTLRNLAARADIDDADLIIVDNDTRWAHPNGNPLEASHYIHQVLTFMPLADRLQSARRVTPADVKRSVIRKNATIAEWARALRDLKYHTPPVTKAVQRQTLMVLSAIHLHSLGDAS